MRKFWKQQKSCYGAFTLAEMMVVMLIMSIILAAMAPVMTTRNKSDYSSPWRYSTNGSDAYFGAGEQQVALIGQHDTTGDDADTKLLINVADNSTFSHILFKQGASILGRLSLDQRNNLYLSNTRPNENSERNTTVGIDALSANTAGDDNVAIGHNAIATNTDGSLNTAIGSNALNSNTGSGNVAIGANSLQGNTAGTDNIAIGTNSNNVVSGFPANLAKSIAIGYQSTAYGNGSIAIGSSMTTDEQDGGAALSGAYTVGLRSIAIGSASQSGYDAGSGGTIGDSIAIGTSSISNGGKSIAIGRDSNAKAVNSISIGTETISSNQYSIAIGDEAETYGDYSLAIGPYLAKAYGENSIAIGREAQSKGLNGIAIGNGAKSVTHRYLSSKGNNIAIGTEAMGTADATNESIAIGTRALYKINTTSVDTPNIGIGYYSLTNLDNGSSNVALGPNSLKSLLAGSNNTAIGSLACSRVTGSNKICIGANSGPNFGSDAESDNDERVFIGSRSNFNAGSAVLEVHNSMNQLKVDSHLGVTDTGVVINGNLIVKGIIVAKMAYAGGSGGKNFAGNNDDISAFATDENGNLKVANLSKSSEMYNYYNSDGEFSHSDSVFSDRRLKYVGTANTSGLDKIRQLKVFNYTFKKDEKKTPHVGVIAQDLQKVFPDAVKKGVDGFLTIRMEDMFYAVINAIKELDSRVTALEKENQELKSRLDKLEAKIK